MPLEDYQWLPGTNLTGRLHLARDGVYAYDRNGELWRRQDNAWQVQQGDGTWQTVPTHPVERAPLYVTLADPTTGVAAPLPPLHLRHPYLGTGPDGARRSAQIDQEEADCLDPGDARDAALLSAERWRMQAEYLEEHDHTPRDCQCEHPSHDDPATGAHPYLGVPAGQHRAQHYGGVCDTCAHGHLSWRLLPDDTREDVP